MPSASHTIRLPTARQAVQYPSARSSLKTVPRTVFIRFRPSQVQVLYIQRIKRHTLTGTPLNLVGVFITQVNLYYEIRRDTHSDVRPIRTFDLSETTKNKEILEVSDYERIRKVYYRRENRAEI